jgi:uncharacterized damage-inducible protein DinB
MHRPTDSFEDCGRHQPPNIPEPRVILSRVGAPSAFDILVGEEESHDMNADAFRHFYGYHFTENRKIWDEYIGSLSDEQFTHDVKYSRGSVRDQILHLMSVDDTWFSALRGAEIPDSLDPAAFGDRETIRAQWDDVERSMRDYLSTLRDDMLLEKPFADGEDKDLILWQVLLQVGTHGTDHRAQVLRLLSDLGVKTVSQDYIFYAYDNPL